MTNRRVISAATLALTAAGLAVFMLGCSSAPKPANPDGSSRVPANDEARIQALQERVAQDRTLLTENNLLKAQVAVLQQQVSEMSAIVREALVLPPPVVAKAPAAQPQPSFVLLPEHSYQTTPSGVVIRVFHPFARTEFEPSEPVAQAIRASLRGAQGIEVRGHTDSSVVNPMDRLIAVERAARARTWLIENGADASKIRTEAFTAGHFLTENRSHRGRSLNRRVEIDIRNPQLQGSQVASTPEQGVSP